MSADIERAQVLEALGYTPRQAAFLAMVAVHGGHFLRRQYVAFIGGSHGRATVKFLAAAARRGHVQALPYGRNGHVFHLCARPVYAAIGQEHNRNRRPAEWTAVVRKLMTLDFVLEHRQATFWGTEQDKVALFEELGIARELWPARQYQPRRRGAPGRTRYFVDKMPWLRMPSEPRLWCAYIDTERTIGGFKTFLQQYASLLEAAAAGVVHVSTGVWRGPVEQTFRGVLGACESRALPTTEFLDYCRLREAIESQRWGELSVAAISRFREIRAEFASHFFDELYARWKREGPSFLNDPQVQAPRAIDTCAVRVHRLPFRYDRDQGSGARPAVKG